MAEPSVPEQRKFLCGSYLRVSWGSSTAAMVTAWIGAEWSVLYFRWATSAWAQEVQQPEHAKTNVLLPVKQNLRPKTPCHIMLWPIWQNLPTDPALSCPNKHVTWVKILYLIEGWNPFVTSCWDFLSERWWSSLLECAGILYTVWSSECAGSYRKGSLFQFQLFPEKALLKLRVNVQKCKSLRSPVLVGTKNQVVPGLLQPQGSSRRSWSCSAIFTTTGGMQQIWAAWQFLVAFRTVQELQDFVQEVHTTATSKMRHHWPGSRQAEIQFISANAAK